MWLFSKAWLEPDHQVIHGMSDEQMLETRLKIIARSTIELVLGCALAYNTMDAWSITYCTVLFVFFVFRSFFSETLTLPAFYFFIAYTLINLIVNTVDYFVFYHLMYYDQDTFMHLFSFKLWMVV
jgi:hypothetical protein